MYVVSFSNLLNFILNFIVSSAIMVDLGGGVAFPVIGNDSALLSYLAVNAQMGSTQMGAFWWDGANTIFKYEFDIYRFGSEFSLEDN